MKEQRSIAGKASAEKRKQLSFNDRSTTVQQSKVNKVKEIKEIKAIEIIDYFSPNGYSNESAKKYFNFYSVADWKDSNGKPVKNWKQKAQSVWFKPENKVQTKPITKEL